MNHVFVFDKAYVHYYASAVCVTFLCNQSWRCIKGIVGANLRWGRAHMKYSQRRARAHTQKLKHAKADGVTF